MMNRLSVRLYSLLIGLLVVAGACAAVYFAGSTSNVYVTTEPAVTYKVVDIPYERALLNYCEALRNVQGVTGISYRSYSPLARTAFVTVYYDPGRISKRQIQTYMGYTLSVWETPVQL